MRSPYRYNEVNLEAGSRSHTVLQVETNLSQQIAANRRAGILSLELLTDIELYRVDYISSGVGCMQALLQNKSRKSSIYRVYMT